MSELVSFPEIAGYWLGIFLTFCILSFLYKDNPFYKFAEHLFIGVSIGYIIVEQYFSTLHPFLVEKLAAGSDWELRIFRLVHIPLSLALVPLALCVMMFTKAVSKRLSWLSRYPLAFFVALYAGFAIKTVQADLGAQMKLSMQDLDATKVNINTAPADQLAQLPGITPPVAEQMVERRAQARFHKVDDIGQLDLTPAQRQQLDAERGGLIGLDAKAAASDGERDFFRIFSQVLLLLGLLSSLVYFYFSIEQKGPVGKVARFGVWILMIGFGASFGYTVQGRLSLAIGRAMDVLGKDKDPILAERIHGPLVAIVSIAVIIVGILLWELRLRRLSKPPSS
jgi:hypothetical protein